jgi:hypothetical protein
MITLVRSKVHVISESCTDIHTYSARSWQAVSTTFAACFQLLNDGDLRVAAPPHVSNLHGISF